MNNNNKKTANGTKTSKTTAMLALLEAGKKEELKVKDIKSVAVNIEEEIPEVNEISKEVSIPPTIQESLKEELIEAKKDTNKGLSMLFTKREVSNSEAIKIPRELHRELKILASMSGITMMQMVGNLIADFLETNEKEIASYKKKYLNGK